jgi:hypothetical protein
MSLSNSLKGNSSRLLGTIPTLKKDFERTGSRHLTLANRLTFRCFEVCFDLSADQEELIQDSLAYLPLECEPCFSSSVSLHYSLVHCSDSSESQQVSYQLYRNGRRIFACSDRHALLERFSSMISLDVAESSPIRTFVHAGVVGWGKSAVLIPGRSFSGKTTLVAELVRAGATYYSDEFAVIDRLGMVFPYARPLQVRESGSYRQTQRPVEELGGVAGIQALPVKLVIVSQYAPGAHWRPRQLSPGIGLLKILDNTVSARRSPAIVLSTLKQVVSDALVARGARGEASQVVEWITTHFGSPKAHCESTK